MKKWVQKNPNGIIVHSAAVGDYEALPRSTKIPSGQKELHLTLGPTIKILDQIRKWSDHVKIISFKAASPETTLEELSIIAQKQRERSSSALVFANILGKIDKDVQLVTKDHVQTFSDREDALTALLQWIRREQEILDS